MNIKTICPNCVVVYTNNKNGCTFSATVYSYDTPVLHLSGTTDTLHRVWSGYSVTTVRHINRAFPWIKMTKNQWESMPVERLADCL